MSRVISFRDLQRIPFLSSYSEVELLQVSMDAKVNLALGQLGFNLDAPILYVPVKHRDMAGGVGVGYRAVGEINNDKAYLDSPVCPQIERLIWASRQDMSLARLLARMMGHSINLSDDSGAEEDPFIGEEYLEPDCEEVTAEIRILENLRDELRGSPYNEFGALKTPKEYLE